MATCKPIAPPSPPPTQKDQNLNKPLPSPALPPEVPQKDALLSSTAAKTNGMSTVLQQASGTPLPATPAVELKAEDGGLAAEFAVETTTTTPVPEAQEAKEKETAK